MAMEGRLNKILYKLELILLKAIPPIIALCYFLNSIASILGIDTSILSYIGGLSVLPLIFIYVSSWVFKFCLYHRMFIYYVIIIDCFNYYDYYIGIQISNRNLILVLSIITAITMFIILYLKFKVCKKQ